MKPGLIPGINQYKTYRIINKTMETRIKNNEVFFSENGERKKIGYNKSGLPYLGYYFRGKWH